MTKDNTFEVVRAHWPLALYAIILMAGFNALSHGTQDFYPNFLRIQLHFSAGTASLIGIVASLGAICGGLTFGNLSQRVGRRRAITISSLSVIPMVPFWAFYSTQPMVLAVSVFALQFFVQGAWGVIPAHLNELSPAHARATFPGFVYQFGNLLASGVGSLQSALVEDRHWTYSQALAIVAICAAGGVAVLINLGREARDVVMAPIVPH